MLLLAAIFVLVGVVIGLLIYARWHYGSLEKLGIPIVENRHFFLGHAKTSYDKPGGLMDIERFKKYGHVYGVYEGREPQIHICDAELIRLITTKDSEYFNDKRRLDFKDELLNEMPDFQPYEKWKAIRSFLTPAFSSAKIKLMSESMLITLNRFSTDIQNLIESSPGHKLEKYDLRSEIFTMITDMISRCCFSVQIENPSDPNNAFVNIVRGLMMPDGNHSIMLEILSYSFPLLAKFTPGIFDPKRSEAFSGIFLQMMDARKKSGEKQRDIVDLCLEQMNKLDTPEYKRMNITDKTIICQAFVFFFAGQDQLSTISSCMIYYVLQNPDIEKKLKEEVDDFVKKHNGKIETENLSKLPFLLACLQETLRLVPFFSRTERVCTKDWKNEEFNLEIKKGMTVQIPIWASNRNPKYFLDPEKFDPERFTAANKDQLHPYAFTSFGHGPRNCIGQKFSLDTLLLLNFFLLKSFNFHLRDDSKPEFIPAGPFFTPHMPFYFDLTKRNN